MIRQVLRGARELHRIARVVGVVGGEKRLIGILRDRVNLRREQAKH
jgi:hypothetical protein